jgi:hypothetical protein
MTAIKGCYVIKFSALSSSLSGRFSMIIVDTLDRYKNNWTKDLIKNSIDFEISTATWEGLDVYVCYDEDQTLQQLVNDYEFSIVVSIGFMVGHNNHFYKQLETFCLTNDFLVAGHILDNGDAYYELHDQCYVVNLKKYKNLNCPSIGQLSFHSNHIQTVPLRSLDNFHDTYTPIWITPGTTSKKYTHKCHGWNIISTGLETDNNIITFPDNLRNLKTYFYPDDQQLINRLYVEHTIAATSWVNPVGTSDYSVLGKKTNGNIKYLVTPCVGIDFVHFLAFHGFDENTVVRFVDYNLLSLEFMKRLVEWDGTNFIEFLENFGEEKTKFLNIPSNSWFGVKDELEKKWQDLLTTYDWPELWSKIKTQVTFEFRFTDFLHLGNSMWLDHHLNSPNTIINFSNIFNYYSTSILYTLKDRVEIENQVIADIQQIAPEAYLLFDHRAWRGFKPYTNTSKRAYAKDIEIVSMGDLTMPSWHYDRDWK